MPPSHIDTSGQDDDDGKEIVCEVWSRVTLGLQVVLEHHKKFFENIEAATHRLTQPPHQASLGMSEFWELVSFCAIDLPPGLLLDVYVYCA